MDALKRAKGDRDIPMETRYEGRLPGDLKRSEGDIIQTYKGSPWQPLSEGNESGGTMLIRR